MFNLIEYDFKKAYWNVTKHLLFVHICNYFESDVVFPRVGNGVIYIYMSHRQPSSCCYDYLALWTTNHITINKPGCYTTNCSSFLNDSFCLVL